MNIIKLFGELCTHVWWTNWSNYRWRKAIRHNIGINEEDKVQTIEEIEKLIKRLYNKFEWTKDDMTQLWDSMTPPPQNYQHYLNGILKDDCDGYHALVLHCLYNSGIEAHLLTANAKQSGHCILLFKLNDLWHVLDYTRIYNGFTDPSDAIEDYNKFYPLIYKTKSEVFYNGIIDYDYNTGKFKGIHIKDLK